MDRLSLHKAKKEITLAHQLNPVTGADATDRLIQALLHLIDHIEGQDKEIAALREKAERAGLDPGKVDG